jgi:hypothetical protein
MTMQINGTSGLVFNDASTQNTAAKYGMVNRIINGDCRIDQRNAGASVTLTSGGTYTIDRWQGFEDTDGGITAQQSSVAPAGFTNSLLMTTTSADASLGASQYSLLRQPIEGFNTADLGWGTANAQPVTISFWVRSSLTGTFAGSLRNGAGNRSYVFTYSIAVANTWEQKSITVAGDTTGTWLTNTSTGIIVSFDLGTGSNFQTTAGSWAAGNFWSTTGATSVVGTSGATFYITGVDLRKGTTGATAQTRDVRPYGTELALCQRYCFNGSTIGVDSQVIASGMAYNTTQALLVINVPVSMRVVPSLTSNTNLGIWNASGSTIAISTLTIATSANNSTFRLNATVSSAGLVAGNAAILNTGSPTAGIFILSAEL